MRILAVDDSRTILLAIQRILQKQGYDVVTAQDGLDALGVLARDLSIEMVVTDFRMPGLNGLELCRRARALRRLRKGEAVPAPPFILLTACSDDSAILESPDTLLEQFETILEKPFSKTDLLAAVAQAEQRQLAQSPC